MKFFYIVASIVFGAAAITTLTFSIVLPGPGKFILLVASGLCFWYCSKSIKNIYKAGDRT